MNYTPRARNLSSNMARNLSSNMARNLSSNMATVGFIYSRIFDCLQYAALNSIGNVVGNVVIAENVAPSMANLQARLLLNIGIPLSQPKASRAICSIRAIYSII